MGGIDEIASQIEKLIHLVLGIGFIHGRAIVYRAQTNGRYYQIRVIKSF
jgi:hypothetical protein